MLLFLCGPKAAIAKWPKKSLLTFSHYSCYKPERIHEKVFSIFFCNYPVLATKLNFSISYKNRLLLFFGSEMKNNFQSTNIYIIVFILKKIDYGLPLGAKYKIGFEVHTNTWRWAMLHTHYGNLLRSWSVQKEWDVPNLFHFERWSASTTLPFETNFKSQIASTRFIVYH